MSAANATQEYTERELIVIKESIEKMDKHNQIEVLRILHEHGPEVTLNENRYGVLINLSDLSQSIIAKVDRYLKYVQTQENYLNIVEKQKNEYKLLLVSAATSASA